MPFLGFVNLKFVRAQLATFFFSLGHYKKILKFYVKKKIVPWSTVGMANEQFYQSEVALMRLFVYITCLLLFYVVRNGEFDEFSVSIFLIIEKLLP